MVREDARSPIGFEMHVNDLKLVGRPSQEFPIQKKEHGDAFLMDHRHLWLMVVLKPDRRHWVYTSAHVETRCIRKLMRAQTLQGVFWKLHIVVKQQQELMPCLFVPVVKVHLPRFIAFSSTDIIRRRVRRPSDDRLYAVTAFAVFVLVPHYADITRACIFFIVLQCLTLSPSKPYSFVRACWG